jgi:hypothetical protein
MNLTLAQSNELDKLSFLRRVTSKKNEVIYCIEGTRVFLQLIYHYNSDSYRKFWFYKSKKSVKKKYVRNIKLEEILNSNLIGFKNKENLLFNIDLFS